MRLIDEKEAAEMIGLAVPTLRSGRTRGSNSSPPFYRIGNRIKYDADELVEWVKARRARSTSEADANDRKANAL